MDAEVYFLDSADYDPFTGRVVLKFRGQPPIQVQATLTVMRYLKAAVADSVARLGQLEKLHDPAARNR